MIHHFQRPAHFSPILFPLLFVLAVCALPYKQYRQQHVDHDLIAAILADNANAVLNALDAGANANARDSDKPLPTFWQVFHAYYQRSPAVTNAADDMEEYPRSTLQLALGMKQSHGDAVVVKALIEHGARDFNALNDDDLPVLIWAAAEGYTDIVQALLDRGADVDVYDHEDSNWGALHYAREFHHPEIVQMLLNAGAKR